AGGHRAELAVALLEGADGRRALPGFTDVAAMAAWDPAARPVPVLVPELAEAVDHQGAEVLVVDVEGPVTLVVPPAVLTALADGDPLVPLYRHGELIDRLATVLRPVAPVVSAFLVRSVGADARLVLVLDVDAPDEGELGAPTRADRVRELAGELSEAVRADPQVRALVRLGLEIAFHDHDPAVATDAHVVVAPRHRC
ncbi:MAG: SseB family protein, partial [Actinomycetes bacterium]